MKIDIRCNDGSPLGISMKSLFGKDGRNGVGGSEQYLLSLCDFWTKQGHTVILYNDPLPGWESPFEQRAVRDFEPDANRDVLVMFRSPNQIYERSKGKRIFLSCDQQTVGNFEDLRQYTDVFVTISKFHADYFKYRYGFEDCKVIDIPIRLQDYEGDVEKVPYSCMFNSVPDRGLQFLSMVWPRIVERVPEANLTITSGWSLWNGRDDSSALFPYRMKFRGMKNVEYAGPVKRNELVAIQKRTELFTYPCIYPELFCIAAAEAQVAGAYPITSNMGALETTNMGSLIYGHPDDEVWCNKFVNAIVEYLQQREETAQKAKSVQERAKERFSMERIGEQWANVLSS